MTTMQLTVVSLLTMWAGSTLVLSRLRWFRRVPLIDRLRAYHPGAHAERSRAFSATSFRDVVGPIAQQYGSLLARMVGLREDVTTRLRRVQSPLDSTAFRLRQLGWSLCAFLGAALINLTLDLPPVIGLAMLLGLPVLAALLLEQQLANQSKAYQSRVFLELPVIAEQLAMLLGAGYSLGAALGRLADRGSGVITSDLRRVLNRVHQGLAIDAALTEWADLTAVDELHRLVHVLALHRAAADLGPLIAEEAHSIRREAHRQLVARLELRAQMVWIPVTVAALLPGSIFLIVPFSDALRLVTS